MIRKPLIGVTSDVEFMSDGNPPRDFYFVDARNFDALRTAGAAAVILPH